MLLKFALLALSLTTGSALGECPSNQYVPGIGCDPSDNICEVTCPKDGDCKLTEGCADALVTDTITHAEMTEVKCQDLCNATVGALQNETSVCRFWRYELVSNDQEVCSLMSSSQCQVPEVCTSPSCFTGDVGCPGGEAPVPGDNNECAAKMDFKPSPGYIHWGCVNELDDLSSPYDPNVDTMPANTLCTTAHRCVDWNAGDLGENQTLWRKLRVFCDGTDGQWKRDTKADGNAEAYFGDNGVLGADGSGPILEHKCVGGEPAPTLVVDLASAGNGVGADLVCDVDGSMNGTSNYTITAPNHCLLLCDLHIGMTIDGELNQNGEYDFLDQDGEKITDPAEVICWQGKRI